MTNHRLGIEFFIQFIVVRKWVISKRGREALIALADYVNRLCKIIPPNLGFLVKCSFIYC